MKQKTPKYQGFGVEKTPRQKYQDRLDRASQARVDKKQGVISNMRQWLHDRDCEDAHRKQLIIKNNLSVVHNLPTAHRRGRGEGARSSAKSGDSNSADPDPEPERRAQSSLCKLYDQAALADLLVTSKKSVQNIYSSTPWLLPPALSVPGARGPRWTAQAVHAWLESRPAHTSKQPARKVGRPRIAQAVAKGVQS